MTKILYPELSYKINGLCFQIEKKLGRFCREKQYGELLEGLLKERGISYKREFEIKNITITSPSGNKVDFLIDSIILLDLKAKNFITKDDYFQMQRYLQASKLELGLIVNFRKPHLKPKRILNTKIYNSSSDHSDEPFVFSDRPK